MLCYIRFLGVHLYRKLYHLLISLVDTHHFSVPGVIFRSGGTLGCTSDTGIEGAPVGLRVREIL